MHGYVFSNTANAQRAVLGNMILLWYKGSFPAKDAGREGTGTNIPVRGISVSQNRQKRKIVIALTIACAEKLLQMIFFVSFFCLFRMLIAISYVPPCMIGLRMKPEKLVGFPVLCRGDAGIFFENSGKMAL